MDFRKGDIIEYCGELFQVESNYGNSGAVYPVNSQYKRFDTMISNFCWSAYGEDCKLVKRAKNK